ncbi:TetR/AcrR family transcriptional regulator [Mycobacterium sp. GA-1841]|uniref:TetR/AcrR family transcriptional regulator n=1 Tax=Mycobacterium sp. GA-1841 TaxID=1834154 RepID=UPI0020C94D0E|nr:TetR/AcrR family transcriptional regulator [Mycobacterium sp. GA-1841]
MRIKDVIADAGLTERYFYESFGDLDALFDAMLEITMDTVERAVDAAVADAPDDAFSRISLALRTAVDTLADDPRMIRIIFIEALGKGGRAGTHRNEILSRAAANFFRWSGADPDDFESSPVDARMKAFAISGAASELLIAWAEGLLDISPGELADFLIGLYWRINLP